MARVPRHHAEPGRSGAAGPADGGEILLSEAHCGACRREPPAGYALVELGAHQLKGIRRPESIKALAGPGLATAPAAECPYRGLLAFEPSDRHLFFGREEVLADAVKRIGPGRLLAVLGASGSGKSSLLRAGVACGRAERASSRASPARG